MFGRTEVNGVGLGCDDCFGTHIWAFSVFLLQSPFDISRITLVFMFVHVVIVFGVAAAFALIQRAVLVKISEQTIATVKRFTNEPVSIMPVPSRFDVLTPYADNISLLNELFSE